MNVAPAATLRVLRPRPSPVAPPPGTSIMLLTYPVIRWEGWPMTNAKNPHRRQFLHVAAGAAALPAMPPIAPAQTYPSRPITMIVPFAAGGNSDTIGRILAERMREPLGQ